MGWRRRTPWGRRDWIALAVLAGSIALEVFLASSDVLRIGVRQGLAFLLIFVFLGAAVVLMVRHVPYMVLHFAQPVSLTLGGLVVAFVSDVPARYLAIGASALGLVQLVLQVRAHGGLRKPSGLTADDEDTPAGRTGMESRRE